GEFGGGVINLTTSAIPDENFITIGGSIGGNTETTGELGYTYFGSDSDFTGFDDGARTIPDIFQDALDSGNLIEPGPDFSLEEVQDITASLLNAPTTLVQRNNNIPVNGSIEISAGQTIDIGSDRLGIIANFGWKNSWQTKGGLQQFVTGLSTNAAGEDALIPELGQDFEFLSTENRIVVNGLIGFGYEFGEHKARWTSLYIRDTLKEARIQAGTDNISVGDALLNRSFTNWFERQLIDTQGVIELDFGDIEVDLRGSYAETQRESPYERAFSYRFEDDVNDFVNDLQTNGERASVAFSDLDEDVYSGAFDVSYDLPTAMPIKLSAGFAYSDQQRTATRRDFVYRAEGTTVGPLLEQARPDFLLSDFAIRNFNIVLQDLSSQFGTAAYDAGLEIFGGYGQVEVEPFDFVRAVFGLRYEDSSQFVTPLDLFGFGPDLGDVASTSIDATEFLPAATITWNFLDDTQLRLSASRTLARPQFRELAPQQFFDSESDRTFVGNEFLGNSDLINVEGRLEHYFGRDERISIAGFYKDIDNPIETIATTQGQTFFVTFANAPEAQLFGAEVEFQKYFPLYDVLGGVFGEDSTFFETRDLVFVANYTYTDSEIGVGGEGALTTLGGTGGVPTLASNVFVDGEPLTGQSDHIVNVQIGLEDSETLSQQTLLLNYASSRITNRFTSTTNAGELVSIPFRDIPGVDLDFVARQGIDFGGFVAELKLEARNLLDTRFREIQTFNGSQVDLNTFDRGRTFTAGIGVTF
ncbi:MAG: TonB-dependent receptor, partial [Pseudomonadota bacterium]